MSLGFAIDVMWELEGVKKKKRPQDDRNVRHVNLCLMGWVLSGRRFLTMCRELHTIYGVVRTVGVQGLANEHGVRAVSALDVVLCGMPLGLWPLILLIYLWKLELSGALPTTLNRAINEAGYGAEDRGAGPWPCIPAPAACDPA